jgi:hypothetical protein
MIRSNEFLFLYKICSLLRKVKSEIFIRILINYNDFKFNNIHIKNMLVMGSSKVLIQLIRRIFKLLNSIFFY